MSDENVEKKLDAMLEPPMTVGPVALRPFGAASMRMLHKVKSPFVATDTTAMAAMPPMEICDHVGNFLFIHGADIAAVKRAVYGPDFEGAVVSWLMEHGITAGQLIGAAGAVVKSIQAGMIGLDYQVDQAEGVGPN